MNIKSGMQWIIMGGDSGSVLGRGPGRNGRVAVGSKETLQGWLDVSVRGWEEPRVSSEFCACEPAFERRGQCGEFHRLSSFQVHDDKT